ncbi:MULTISPECIES: LysR family transcriptional regulator [Oxalobacteraceae]|jgi:DNA-binding transcriptional LysR family regulator|uniref:LysR family transcriptional regulator n=1 Tax=Oxalobacteraceae TaxID=75682 RepID=UPI0010A4818A|nr:MULTISPECIES: LysR family transcriptional regulator [Oxalobacteraceae]
MNLSRVDLNLFVVFEAIFTLGSITAAGRKLNLSQPAVSHALARLRTLFDDPLFERSSRGMEPTPLARALILDVRNALERMEGTLHRTVHFDPSTTRRRFTVAMGDPFDSLLLPLLMERIGPVAPGIEVATLYSDRRRVEPALLEGSLDLAVDLLLPMPPTINLKPILSEPMIVMARRGHPDVRGKIDLDTYLGQEHIQVSSRRRGLSAEDMALRRCGLTRHVRLRCEHYGAACRIVSRTNMLMTMPFSFASMANESVQNQLLPVPFPVPHLELFLYWNISSDSDAACRWLREQILLTMAEVQGHSAQSTESTESAETTSS